MGSNVGYVLKVGLVGCADRLGVKYEEKRSIEDDSGFGGRGAGRKALPLREVGQAAGRRARQLRPGRLSVRCQPAGQCKRRQAGVGARRSGRPGHVLWGERCLDGV